jgi:ABC-type antimicrobial peptide transport system permease subunit
VRIALGGSRLDITGMVFREILLLAIGGIVIGVPATLACARFIGSFLLESDGCGDRRFGGLSSSTPRVENGSDGGAPIRIS